MSGKNNHTQPPDPQIQQLINTHQSIAANLHNNTSEEDIRETLAPCFDLPEESQLTLLKALASEQTVQAADIALAIQTYTEIKAVRKEARRALLQLQSARIYPAWEPAPAPSITQMIQQFAAPAPIGDDDDDADYDVAPARPQSLMGTLENDLSLLRSMFMGKPAEGAIENFLIAWSDGRYNEAYDLLAHDSSLREGLTRKQWVKRRQQWRKQSQPGELKIGFMHTPATATGPDQETVVDTGWSLAFANRPDHDEVLPELPQATLTYAESGRHWFWSSYTLTEEHGKPRIMQMTDEGTRASQLPTSELQQRLDEIAALATERYTQLEAEAREMNEALEEDEDDEVEELNTEELSNTEELEDEETDLDDLEDDEDDDDEDDSDLAWEFGTMMERAQEAFHITTRALHYSDALIAQEPTADITIYQKAFEQSGITQDLERAATYAQLMAERFPEQRSEALCMLATAQTRIGEMLADEMDDEQAEHYAALAEKTLREAFETYNDPTSAILLSQLLVKKNQNLDEAESLLQQIASAPLDSNRQASRAYGLGAIAALRGQQQEALSYFQQAADLVPDFPTIWQRIGHLQRELGLIDEAEQSLLRSIEQESEPEEAYIDLALLYTEDRHNLDEAADTIEEGLEAYPDSADLRAVQALHALLEGDRQSARDFLAEAESYDPDAPTVQLIRDRIKKS